MILKKRPKEDWKKEPGTEVIVAIIIVILLRFTAWLLAPTIRRGAGQVASKTEKQVARAADPATSAERNDSVPTTAPFTWRDIQTFAAAIGAGSIAIAVAREVGFFWYLHDSDLLRLFTVQDVLTNSLQVIPWALYSWAIGALCLTKWLVIPTRTLGWTIAFCVAANALLSLQWPLFSIFGNIIISGLILSLVQRYYGLGHLPIFQVLYAVGVIGQFLTFGMIEANTAVKSPERNYELTMDGTVENVNLLRAGADFLLVMREPTEIWVVPRPEVKLLKQKQLEWPLIWGPLAGHLKSLWAWLGVTSTEPAEPEQQPAPLRKK